MAKASWTNRSALNPRKGKSIEYDAQGRRDLALKHDNLTYSMDLPFSNVSYEFMFPLPKSQNLCPT